MFLQFTGRSGAGKTTLALRVQELLLQQHIPCMILDGDVYRQSLCKDLGFSVADRRENIRRLGKHAAESRKEGQVVILAAINPFEQVRQELAAAYGAQTVWIDCSLDELLKRDTKGLYRRACLPADDPGYIGDLLGQGDLYEDPPGAVLHVQTHLCDIETAAVRISSFILADAMPRGVLPAGDSHQK